MKSRKAIDKTVSRLTEDLSDLMEELSDEEAGACVGGLDIQTPLISDTVNPIVDLGVNISLLDINVAADTHEGGSLRASRSDRNQKENFAPVDVQEILGKVATLPIETWNYKDQDANIRHIGPMAQDFSAAFSVGEDNRLINVVDASGVALAAIQAIYKQLQEKNAEISTMRVELDALKQQMRETQVPRLIDTPHAVLNCN